MLLDAGPDLDRQIERKLNGDAKKRTPPYSTSEKAASRLLRRLEMQDMPCTIDQIDELWYCTFWTLTIESNSRERLSTGSGETRALAVARAVLNARLGMGPSLAVSASAPMRRAQWLQVTGAAPEAEATECSSCGANLPTRNRAGANRYCAVCAWRKARKAAGSRG